MRAFFFYLHSCVTQTVLYNCTYVSLEKHHYVAWQFSSILRPFLSLSHMLERDCFPGGDWEFATGPTPESSWRGWREKNGNGSSLSIEGKAAATSITEKYLIHVEGAADDIIFSIQSCCQAAKSHFDDQNDQKPLFSGLSGRQYRI